jgi:hypothetical protein
MCLAESPFASVVARNFPRSTRPARTSCSKPVKPFELSGSIWSSMRVMSRQPPQCHGALPIWRRDEDKGPFALRITRHGRAAVGVDERGALRKDEENRDTRQGTELLLKTPKGRESPENFAPPPYRRGHDHNSVRLRFPALVPLICTLYARAPG